MAQTSTLYRFQVELSEIDRNMYESLDLRAACHPSEDAERLVVRALARVLCHEEGLDFGRGLSNAEEPALWSHTMTGEVDLWIDVGLPSAERVHRASKAAKRVVLVTSKPEASLRKEWSSRQIHEAGAIEILRLPNQIVTELADALERSVQWYVTVQDGTLSVAYGDLSVSGPMERVPLTRFLQPN